MLKQFISKLLQELELEESAFNGETPSSYVLSLEDTLSIYINEISNGFIIKCQITAFPAAKQEAIATEMMLANLFGQGTSGSTLGLNPDGSVLTLSRVIDYPIDYKDFKGVIEDFINIVDFWREEALSQTYK